MGNFDIQFFDDNPNNKVSSLDEITANVPKDFSFEVDENVSHETKQNLIKGVFENYSINSIKKSNTTSFNDGGDVDSKKDYTPYEFLHELLPKVYKANGYPRYVVSDEEGEKIYQEIDKRRSDFEKDVKAILEENGADTIYELEADKIEQLNKRKKDIENQEIFITQSELEAYVLTNTHLKTEDYLKEVKNTIPDLLDKGLVCLDYNQGMPKYVYKYQYISGDVYDKISDLQTYRDEIRGYISEEQLNYQYDILQKSKKPLSRISTSNILSIYLHPFSHFCTDFSIVNLSADDFVDWEDNTMDRATIQIAFIEWLSFAEKKGLILPNDYKGTSIGLIIDIYVRNNFPDSEKTALTNAITSKYSDRKTIIAKLEKAVNNRKEKIQKLAEPLFSKFLNEALTNDAKQRIELIWNRKYNFLVNPIFHKIPVATAFSRNFKNNAPFIPNPTQIQSVQFMETAKSGLLAYGVGVGKTASSIINVAYSLSNNKCSFPLFIVPRPTYKKWIMEMQGGRVKIYTVTYKENGIDEKINFDDEKKAHKFAKKVNGEVRLTKDYMSKGLLPSLPNIVELGNLNWKDFVENNIKTYSKEDYDKIGKLEEGIDFLKTIKNEYSDFSERIFDVPHFYGFQEKHLSKILSYFPYFDQDEFAKQYNMYQSLFKPDPLMDGKIALAKEKKKLPTEILLSGFDKNDIYIAPLNKRLESLKYSLGTYNSFPEKTIFIATYQALKYIAIEDKGNEDYNEEYGDAFASKLVNELTQGENLEILNNAKNGSTFSNKIISKIYGEKYEPNIYLSELKTDYLVVDESHFFKKVFTDTVGKYDKSRGYKKDGHIFRLPKKYQLVKNAPIPSELGLSMYVITRYIQSLNAIKNPDNNGIGGNVCHLTATPFTNSPLEVYSMMALTNMDFLKKTGFSNIEDFFDAFMKIEYAMRYKGSKITKEQVLVGYNNSPQMKSLIYYLMDYKSGEDANIKRPDRYVIPNEPLGISSLIQPTDEQMEMLRDIKSYMRGAITLEDVCGNVTEELDIKEITDDEIIRIIIEQGSEAQQEKFSDIEVLTETLRLEAETIVTKILEKDVEEAQEDLSKEEQASYRTLKGITYMKQITLSPYLLQCKKERDSEPSYYEYVNSSPKILYSLGCIKSTHDYEDKRNLKRSGIVIYMNIGVHPSADVPIGDPVGKTTKGELIYGSYKKVKWSKSAFQKIKNYLVAEMGYKDSEIVIVSGQQQDHEKESAKNKFLSGDAVVLIGSSTISTGVDLQENASSLFMCAFDWNPTDNEQIAGRIHRQGNPFDKVRICYPMISDSVDPLIFQLLQEKNKRIKAIWDKDGVESTLNVDDIDYGDLQGSLITDPQDRLDIWFEKTSEKLNNDIEELNQKASILKNSVDSYNDYNSLIIPVRKTLSVIDHFKKYKKQQEGIQEVKRKINEVTNSDFYDELDKDGNVIKDATMLMIEAVSKVKKDSYDYQNDPDGRYVVTNYDDASDDILVKKLKYELSGVESWISKINNWNNHTEKTLLMSFLSSEYPEYIEGYWISEVEAKKINDEINLLIEKVTELANNKSILDDEIDKLSNSDILDSDDVSSKEKILTKISELESEKAELNISYIIHKEELSEKQSFYQALYGGVNRLNFDSYGFAVKKLRNTWYDAWRDLKVKSRVLKGWGLNDKDVSKARIEVLSKLEKLNAEFENLERMKDSMLVKFQQEFIDSRTTAPSVEDVISQFDKSNDYFLNRDDRLNTFEEDKTAIIKEVPKQDIKPKVSEGEESKIEDVEIVEVSDESDTFVDENDSDEKIKRFYEEIDGYVMLVDLADTSEEMDSLYEKIEAYIDLLELEGEPIDKINELKKRLTIN